MDRWVKRDVEHPINVNAVRAFVSLNFIGGIGLFVVVVTALFSRNVKRLPSWFSFCISWIFSCISYTLLTFAGQQFVEYPSYSLCLTQAALVYAIPPLTSCTTLALLIQIVHNFSDTLANPPNTPISQSSPSLLVGPYFIFTIVIIGVVLSEKQGPQTVTKAARGTYCYSKNLTWERVSFAFVGAISILILFVQVLLAFRIYRCSMRGSPSIATALRGLLFSFISVLTAFVSMALAITEAQSLTFDIILAMLPILALAVFGSQHDLIRSWVYWKTSFHKL